jgi:hypothetical protein
MSHSCQFTGHHSTIIQFLFFLFRLPFLLPPSLWYKRLHYSQKLMTKHSYNLLIFSTSLSTAFFTVCTMGLTAESKVHDGPWLPTYWSSLYHYTIFFTSFSTVSFTVVQTALLQGQKLVAEHPYPFNNTLFFCFDFFFYCLLRSGTKDLTAEPKGHHSTIIQCTFFLFRLPFLLPPSLWYKWLNYRVKSSRRNIHT